MSHEVVFLPHILGQTWAQALAAARTAAREEDPRIVAARLEPWPDLVLHAAQILGQIEEFRGRGQRELVHPVTRLRFTFFGEDGVIALPYWYDGPVARMAATMAFRFAHAVEADTGLAAYDPQQRTPLAEMGLEKFVAGYLRGRDKALSQPRARGPVPVGHALPTGRSASRRELAAGPSAAREVRERQPAAEMRATRADARPEPASGDVRGGQAGAGWLRRGAKPARGEGADARQGAERRQKAEPGRETSPERVRRAGEPARGARQAADSRPLASPDRLRRAGEPARGEREAERRRPAEAGGPANSDRRRTGKPARGEAAGAESGPSAGPDRLRRAGEPARGERDAERRRDGRPQAGPPVRGAEPAGGADSAGLWRPADPAPGEPSRPEPGVGWLRRGAKQAKTPEPRKAPRRGERSDAEQPPRKASRRERAEAERSRKAERGVPPPGAEWVPRPGSPEPRGGGPAEGRRGELRRVEPPKPRRAPEPGETSGGQPRRKPPELPDGRR